MPLIWYTFVTDYLCERRFMKMVQLIHNPSAGDGEIDKKKLIELIEDQDYQCRYSSTKDDDWKDIDQDTDLIVVAGGDGTVRKVVKQVLKRGVLQRQIPISLIPLGTANNIAKTLKLELSPKKLIRELRKSKSKAIDIGSIYNIEEADFFLESFGYGIFPYLMQVMKGKDEKFESAEDELHAALKEMHSILQKYEARECVLEIDGTDHSGKFILAEIMNTRSIGPNLALAPMSDPGDGELEVVLVPENQKDKFADYISNLLAGEDVPFQFFTMQGKQIRIKWAGSHVHIDDKVVKLEKNKEVCVEIKTGLLKFLIAAQA